MTYGISGFVNADTSSVVSGSASLTTTATTTSPAGKYPITFATKLLIATNYNFSYVPGTLTVTPVSAGADLLLRINITPTSVRQGDLLTYAFPVWDLGPDSAVHEVLNTQVPAGTTFDSIRISGTPGLGTCIHPAFGNTGPIICHENSSMASNTTWTVRLTVKITARSGTVIKEGATATEDTPDPNPANNTATVSTTVH